MPETRKKEQSKAKTLPPEKIREIKEDIALALDKSFSRLLRDETFLPFMPEMLNYNIVYTENLPAPAAIRSDYDIMYINPVLINHMKNKYDSLSLLAFVLLHEINHVILFHSPRCKHRDPDVWNIATDFVINNLLKGLSREARNGRSDDCILKCDSWDYAHDFLFDDRFDNLLEEEVYAEIEKNHTQKTTKKIKLKDMHNGQFGQGQGSGTGGDEGDAEITETTITIGNKKFKSTRVNFPRREFESSSAKKKFEDKKAERIGMTRQMIEGSVSKGVGSAAMKSFLKRLFNVEVDWGQILGDSIATALEPSSELSWSKPRVTWLANAHNLPYLPNEMEEEKFGTLVFAVDESGSMADDDIRKAVKIVNDSKQYYKRVWVIKHDHAVVWEKKYEEAIDAEELLHRRSYGGTSHRDVFDKVVHHMKTEPDDMISAFIGFSDMYSDIAENQDMIPSSVPMIWIATEPGMDFSAIRGRIIRIKDC